MLKQFNGMLGIGQHRRRVGTARCAAGRLRGIVDGQRVDRHAGDKAAPFGLAPGS